MKLIDSLSGYILRIAREIYHTLRPEITVMAGLDKTSGEQVAICYAGVRPRSYRLAFPSQVFSELQQELILGPHWIWQVKRISFFSRCAFTLVESPHYLRPLVRRIVGAPVNAPFIPFYVHSTIKMADLPYILANNKNLKNDIRKSRKSGYTLEVCNQPDQYRVFIESYYQPYMETAHGSLASHFDYSFLFQPDFPDREIWELQKIMCGDSWIAGTLVRKGERIAYCHEVGVRNGDSNHVRRGAVAASYWYCLQRMQALGYDVLSFMWSPPFLYDGVLTFKKKYRPHLDAAPTAKSGLLLVPAKGNPTARRLLLSIPMIELSGGKLRAKRFVASSADITAAQQQLKEESRRFSGICCHEVILLET